MLLFLLSLLLLLLLLLDEKEKLTQCTDYVVSWTVWESNFDSWEGKETYRFSHSVQAYIVTNESPFSRTKRQRDKHISAASTALVKNQLNTWAPPSPTGSNSVVFMHRRNLTLS
jgi:hypothetical protein